MGDAYLDKISEFVSHQSRLCFSGHKREILRHRLESRLKKLGLANYAAYWYYLKQTSGEETVLLDCLTTNETFFFRNTDQFSHLRDVIIPDIETLRGQDVVKSWGGNSRVPALSIMKLRVLSAGCSTGEEPYSIAMTILESLRHPKAWDLEIIAGDLSESCLKTATEGYYENEKLKNIPDHYIDKYMRRDADGAVIREEVRNLVSFTHLNLNGLMKGVAFPGAVSFSAPFDIIFCRNVMIYFSSSCQQMLVDMLHRLLVPGGYLFTGDAEPLHLFDHDFETIKGAKCLIYKKTEMTDYA
ncbi:MAG: protein-glutamate O-methyltransferase CheR [Desulfuromonadales bacterium]|nr:protein-glutamate O-methyltransferase CheR [Desulfuromonadales bacterium]